MTQSIIANLITPLLGRSVLANEKDGRTTRYTIAMLSDKIGTLKDGSKGEYVVLTKDGDTGVVVNLHPNTAKKLANKGEGDGYALAAQEQQAAADAVVSEDQTTPTEAQPPVHENPVVEVIHPAIAALIDAEPSTPIATVEPVVKAPRVTKKSQTVEIYKTMAADGKARKDIIVEMKAKLGISDACANTYYQNCKGGTWA